MPDDDDKDVKSEQNSTVVIAHNANAIDFGKGEHYRN